MGLGKRVEFHAVLEDPVDGWQLAEVILEKHDGADKMRDHKNIGDRRCVADAEFSSTWVAGEHFFQRVAGGLHPVPDPFDPGRLIEAEFFFEIAANAGHDQRVRFHGNDLAERAGVGAVFGASR